MTYEDLQFTLEKVTLPLDPYAMELDDLKERLRIDISDDDALLQAMLLGCQEKLEKEYEIILIDTELAVYWDTWPARLIELPKQVVSSINLVEYYDIDDALQTFADWQSDLISDPVRILPIDGEQWPETYPKLNAVKISYNAGYADKDSVPEQIKLALGLMVGHYYENREDSSPITVKPIPEGVSCVMSTFRRGILR